MAATPQRHNDSPAEVEDVPDDSTFAMRLVMLRAYRGNLSIEEAAKRSGLPAATWATWEKGRSPRNMAQVVSAIRDGLGVNPSWLMWGDARTGSSWTVVIGPAQLELPFSATAPGLTLVHC